MNRGCFIMKENNQENRPARTEFDAEAAGKQLKEVFHGGPEGHQKPFFRSGQDGRQGTHPAEDGEGPRDTEYRAGSDEEGMNRYVPGRIISRLTGYMEVAIAGLILLALIIATVKIVMYFPALWSSEGTDGFTEIIGFFFTLIIGIEIIHMLSKHTPGAALEVVLFCIARYIIVSEGSGLDKLLAVAAIGIIFVVRKFAFVHSFEE